MSESDREYYRRRAEEELAAANMATSNVAASTHRRLAELYLALARENPVEKAPEKFDFRSR